MEVVQPFAVYAGTEKTQNVVIFSAYLGIYRNTDVEKLRKAMSSFELAKVVDVKKLKK